MILGDIIFVFLWTWFLIRDLKKEPNDFMFTSKAFTIAWDIAWICYCILDFANDTGVLYKLTE